MIGEVLKLIRTIKGYKAKDIAEKMNISPSYLSQVEKGVKKPSFEFLEKYAEAVGERSSTILFFDEEYSDTASKPITALTRPTIIKILRALAAEPEERNAG